MLPAVVVLAAGLSRRFGAADKLMAEVRGRPMVAHVLDTVRAVDAAQRVAVTQLDSGVVDLAEGFEVVINPDPEAGIGWSIVLGDMPFVEASAYAALTAVEADIVVPVYADRRGHPVLFGRACFDELSRLKGPAGAKRLIESGLYRVATIALAGRGGLVDPDRP